MSSYDDDEIGYGKPPRYTRFTKGRSGNPKGRPRKQKTAEVPLDTQFDDTLRELNDRKMMVKLSGKEQKISAFKAIVMKQQQAALGGSVPAQRDIIRTKEELDHRDALRKEAACKTAEEAAEREEQKRINRYNYLVSLHAEQTAVHEQAAAAGPDPDPRYPYPDDFRFDHQAMGATIVGPWDADHAHHYVRIAKQRDFHFVDHIIQIRQRPKGTRFARRLSAIMMTCFDMMLPKREQLKGEQLKDMFGLLYMLPMRDLREWRDDLDFWLRVNPLPELDKKGKREVYKEVNEAMKPLLKPLGFRSLAQLENHCEQSGSEA